METLWDVTLELDDVGGLALVATVLADAEINIDSVCIAGVTPPVTCHLLVSDGAVAAAALAAAGVSSRAREVVVCVLQNRPGTLAAVSAALNACDATVDLLYQATERGLVIGADELGAVRHAVVASGRLSAGVGAAGGVARDGHAAAGRAR
jgi:hypothetical protein